MVDSSYGNRAGVLSSYVLRGREVAVVDPGPATSIEKLVGRLRQIGIDLNDVKHIILTHIHLDHAGGSWRLLRYCIGAKVHVHPKGYSHLLDPSRLEQSARALLGSQIDEYGEVKAVPEQSLVETSDGEVIDLGGGTKINILWTPGHASHHQSLYVTGASALILGDAAGLYRSEPASVLPTSPPPFNVSQAIASIDRLMKLSPKILGYAHFGIARNAPAMLQVHRNQIELWARIAEDGARAGKTLAEIYEELWKCDSMLQISMPQTLLDVPPGERSPAINLRGFVEYARWKQEQQGNRGQSG